jgi:hypothetical protein
MMLTRISLVFSLFFLLFGANTYAHSHLETSAPNNGEVVTETAENGAAQTTNATISDQTVLLKNEADAPTLKAYIIPGIMGLLIILGASSYWLILRRKYI